MRSGASGLYRSVFLNFEGALPLSPDFGDRVGFGCPTPPSFGGVGLFASTDGRPGCPTLVALFLGDRVGLSVTFSGVVTTRSLFTLSCRPALDGCRGIFPRTMSLSVMKSMTPQSTMPNQR